MKITIEEIITGLLGIGLLCSATILSALELVKG